MKKVLLMICMFFMMGCVSVSAVTLDEVSNVINNGNITKEFIEKKKIEIDTITKKAKWNDVRIISNVSGNAININYQYVGDEESVAGNVTASLQDDGKTLKSIITYKEKDEYHYANEIELHNLLVFWVIEASDGFETIKTYVEKDYMNKFNQYFDKCFRQEMHACRTNVSTYGNYEYISDVELNEEPANYVIGLLKEEARKAKNQEVLYILLIAGIIIGVLLLIAKSLQPKQKVKVMKY